MTLSNSQTYVLFTLSTGTHHYTNSITSIIYIHSCVLHPFSLSHTHTHWQTYHLCQFKHVWITNSHKLHSHEPVSHGSSVPLINVCTSTLYVIWPRYYIENDIIVMWSWGYHWVSHKNNCEMLPAFLWLGLQEWTTWSDSISTLLLQQL